MLLALQLDTQDRAARQDAALFDAQKAAELREQFIAVLAHDLRNPLASISADRRTEEVTLNEVERVLI